MSKKWLAFCLWCLWYTGINAGLGLYTLTTICAGLAVGCGIMAVLPDYPQPRRILSGSPRAGELSPLPETTGQLSEPKPTEFDPRYGSFALYICVTLPEDL